MKHATKIEFKNITKTFLNGKIVANDKLSFKVEQGEIHALIGENGAGKSTLMSILFGIYQPTAGAIYIDGKEEFIKSPTHATSLGLGMVHQHFKLVDIYNAIDNILLGKEPTKFGFMTKKAAKDKIKKLAKLYKFDIDLNIPVGRMSVGMQQKVEILKMLYSEAEVLIFDEPTAVLTPEEIQGFLNLLLDFKKKGKTIIIITHKLEEIKQVCDMATVIRKGTLVKTGINVSKTSVKEMAELMVGRELQVVKNKPAKVKADALLELKNICVKKEGSKKLALDNVSLDVKPGEIVAIAGVEGNGQSQLAKVLSGMIKANSGKIIFDKKDVSNMNPKRAILNGISHIPEDRHKHGLVLDQTIGENMTLNQFWFKPYSMFGILNQSRRKMFAKNVISQFDVRGANDGEAPARGLSGGNQQKAIVGREILKEHKLLIAVQPTRGLDLGAIEYIHSQLIAEKERGNSVLLISYELSEIIDLADRVAVINDGKITGIVEGKDINKNKIGVLMASQKGM